jgi:uncharacterized protein (DUF1778 family)
MKTTTICSRGGNRASLALFGAALVAALGLTACSESDNLTSSSTLESSGTDARSGAFQRPAPPTLEELNTLLSLTPEQSTAVADALDGWTSARPRPRGGQVRQAPLVFLADVAPVLTQEQFLEFADYLVDRRQAAMERMKAARLERSRGTKPDHEFDGPRRSFGKRMDGMKRRASDKSQRAGREGEALERRVELLTRLLTLSEAQQEQVTAALQNAASERRALRSDAREGGIPREEAKERAGRIEAGTADAIRQVLGDEQKARFEALQPLLARPRLKRQ